MKKLFEFKSFSDLYTWVMASKSELEFPLNIKLVDKATRSVKQNSLMWKWLMEIEMQTGDSKDTWHEFFKEKYAVPIFRSTDIGYNAMIMAMIELKKMDMTQEFEAAKAKIIELTSTTKFTTKEMDYYLHQIWFYAVGNGWILTHPDDQGLEGLV